MHDDIVNNEQFQILELMESATETLLPTIDSTDEIDINELRERLIPPAMRSRIPSHTVEEALQLLYDFWNEEGVFAPEIIIDPDLNLDEQEPMSLYEFIGGVDER